MHNDVLNEVLKGGELLKIRGLWRSGSNDYIDHHYPGTSNGRDARIQIQYDRERPVVLHNSLPDDRSHPREPPIITTSSANRPTYNYPSSSVYVKKDIARDPGSRDDCETCRITLQETHPNSNPQLSIDHSNQSFLNGSHSYPRSAPNVQPKNNVRQFFTQKSMPDQVNASTSQRQFTSLPEERLIREGIPLPHPAQQPPATTQNQLNGVFNSVNHLPNETNAIDPAPVIKQEPQDWPDEYDRKPPLDVVPVKREIVYGEVGDGGENSPETAPVYNPLTCELCKETFTVPAEWVKHIENHAETPQTVPKKRRRTEVS